MPCGLAKIGPKLATIINNERMSLVPFLRLSLSLSIDIYIYIMRFLSQAERLPPWSWTRPTAPPCCSPASSCPSSWSSSSSSQGPSSSGRRSRRPADLDSVRVFRELSESALGFCYTSCKRVDEEKNKQVTIVFAPKDGVVLNSVFHILKIKHTHDFSCPWQVWAVPKKVLPAERWTDTEQALPSGNCIL